MTYLQKPIINFKKSNISEDKASKDPKPDSWDDPESSADSLF